MDAMVLIPSERCQEGASHCLDNAIGLLQESTLLFRNEMYSRSCGLAIYALEEIAKGKELFAAFRNGNGITKTKWNKLTRYGAHLRKIRTGRSIAMKHMEDRFQSILPRLRRLPESEYEEARRVLAKHYQWWRNQCFYVDWNQGNWITPSRFSEQVRILYAFMEIAESFEGCKALAKELGRDTSNLEKDSDEFGRISSRRLDCLLGWKRDESRVRNCVN